MKDFREYISESIEDKGIFKCIFLGGSPGSGKSYTRKKISDGRIEPRIVNTDKFFEYLAQEHDIEMTGNPPDWLIDRSTTLTRKQLVQFLNSMLPMFVDGTSASITNLLRRSGIMEGFGYDVGMVWVNANFETAMERIQQRDRKVDPKFVREVFDRLEENKNFYKSKFSTFVEIDNYDGLLTDDVILDAYKTVSSFYSSPVRNPVGVRNIQQLRDEGGKYLSPTLYDMEDIERSVDLWYRRK